MVWPPMAMVCCVVEILSAGGGACLSSFGVCIGRSTVSSGRWAKMGAAMRRSGSKTRSFIGRESNAFFALIALVFGAAYALKTPAFEVPDEVALINDGFLQHMRV